MEAAETRSPSTFVTVRHVHVEILPVFGNVFDLKYIFVQEQIFQMNFFSVKKKLYIIVYFFPYI